MKLNNIIIILLLLCISQTGCLYWRRSIVGGGRIQDGKYYVLENTAWTWWWFTFLVPSCAVNMSIWSEVCPEDENAKTCVDWAFWCRAGAKPSFTNEELLQRWMFGKPILQSNILNINQRFRLLCNDTKDYILLVQRQKHLNQTYVKALRKQSSCTDNTDIVTTKPIKGNCMLWVIQPDDTRIGPYWLPYIMGPGGDCSCDTVLRSRYRANALFCFEPTSQALCVLYREEQQWHFELWEANNTIPNQSAILEIDSEKEPFYFWVSNRTVGVASWSQRTKNATFTTFDKTTLKKQHAISSALFPSPPIRKEEVPPMPRLYNVFEKTPELIRKNGDWLYIVDDRFHHIYSTFSFPFNLESGLSLSKGETREYVLRFNVNTGVREVYYAVSD